MSIWRVGRVGVGNNVPRRVASPWRVGLAGIVWVLVTLSLRGVVVLGRVQQAGVTVGAGRVPEPPPLAGHSCGGAG